MGYNMATVCTLFILILLTTINIFACIVENYLILFFKNNKKSCALFNLLVAQQLTYRFLLMILT